MFGTSARVFFSADRLCVSASTAITSHVTPSSASNPGSIPPNGIGIIVIETFQHNQKVLWVRSFRRGFRMKNLSGNHRSSIRGAYKQIHDYHSSPAVMRPNSTSQSYPIFVITGVNVWGIVGIPPTLAAQSNVITFEEQRHAHWISSAFNAHSVTH